MTDVANCQACGHRLVRSAGMDWRHVNAYGVTHMAWPIEQSIRRITGG